MSTKSKIASAVAIPACLIEGSMAIISGASATTGLTLGVGTVSVVIPPVALIAAGVVLILGAILMTSRMMCARHPLGWLPLPETSTAEVTKDTPTELAARFWEHNPQMQEKETLQTTIRQIPVKEMRDVVEKALLFTHPRMSVKCMKDLLEAIKNIPVHDRENVITWAYSLSADRHDRTASSLPLIQMIQSLQQNQREAIISSARELMVEGMFPEDQAEIIGLISRIPDCDRGWFKESVLKVLGNARRSKPEIKLMRKIQTIPQRERKNVIDWTMRAIRYCQDTAQKTTVIDTLIRTPESERAGYFSTLQEVASLPNY